MVRPARNAPIITTKKAPRKPADPPRIILTKTERPTLRTQGMLLTAIVSLYNSGQYLHNRIQNLIDTDLYKKGQLTIYLVNCQSPDPQDDAIANHYAGIPNLRYEVYEKCTVYQAWNHAIKNTKTPYLTNANTDDIVAPHAYDTLIATIEQEHSILAYSNWYVVIEPNKNWNDCFKGNPDRIGHYNPHANQLSCGHFPIWHRTLHDKVGYFDPTFKALGDADLWYRAWKMSAGNFSHNPEPLGAYLWRYGQNLWHRTDDDSRQREWQTLYSREPKKLDF